MKVVLLLSLSAFLAAAPPSSANQAETKVASAETKAERPRIDRETLVAAIRRYAPVLVAHRDEQYRVTSWDSLKDVIETCTYTEDGQDFTGLCLSGAPKAKKDGTFTADLRKKGGDPKNAKVYVNVKVGKDATDIQYWFLYAFNGPGMVYLGLMNSIPAILPSDIALKSLKDSFPKGADKNYTKLKVLGVHEMDWEHLTVRVSNSNGEILKDQAVFMSAHGAGGWLPARAVLHENPKTKVMQPWAYASLNGHALFSTPDKHFYSSVKNPLTKTSLFALVNDTSSPDGMVDFSVPFKGGKDRWEIIGVQGDSVLKKDLERTKEFQEPYWIHLVSGRWGRYLKKPLPAESVNVLGSAIKYIFQKTGLDKEWGLEAGPQPPWRKDIWDKVEE